MLSTYHAVYNNYAPSVDLTVDWINDKLYWTDSNLRTIEEVDILTLARRVVVQLDTRSSPKGLAVYPLQDHG